MDTEIRNAILEISTFFRIFNQMFAGKAEQSTQIIDSLPHYITREQAAQMLEVSPRTIDRYIRDGKIHKNMLGKRVRVLATDVQNLVKNR